MTKYTRIDDPGDPVLEGNVWVFPDGRTAPLIRGGDETADPEAPPATPEGTVAVTPPTPPAEDGGRTFTEGEVAAIRKQEKDKLYSEIEKEKERRQEMETRVADLQKNVEAFDTDRNEQMRAQQEAAEAAEAERKAREEAEMDAKSLLERREQEFEQRLQETESKWSQQFEELQTQAQAQEAMLEKERAFAVLSDYKQSVLADHTEDIMPHLHRLVTGNTTEEIDASISSAIQLTSDIMEDMAQATAASRGPRGVPATGASPTGPMENQTSQQHLTAEDLRNMSMEQYEQLRPQLLSQARPQR
jgi:DNA repair exonuclease SbcCD ATPase subunit